MTRKQIFKKMNDDYAKPRAMNIERFTFPCDFSTMNINSNLTSSCYYSANLCSSGYSVANNFDIKRNGGR